MPGAVGPASDHSRIRIHLEHITIHLIVLHQIFFPLFSVRIHTSELIYLKFSAVPAHPRLRKKDRAGRIQINNRSNDHCKNYCNSQSRHCSDDINKSFHEQLSWRCDPDI